MTERTYYLRTCDADGKSYGGFQWPLEVGAAVEAPDWDPKPVCGGGLHGLHMGAGNGGLLSWDADAKWIVFSSDCPAIDLGGKSKVQRGVVEHVGDRFSAAAAIVSLGADPSLCVGYSAQCGDGSTLTGGSRSTLTGGSRSTLTGGDDSTLTGGDGSTLTGGSRSTLTGGDGSTLTGGYGSTLTGGYRSTLTGGYGSTLVVRWYDSASRRYRMAVGYVGEDGIEAGVAYRVDSRGCFVRAEG